MAHAVIIISDEADGSAMLTCELMPDAAHLPLEERTATQRVFREMMRFFAVELKAAVVADYVSGADRASSSIDTD